MKYCRVIILICLLATVLAACATQPPPATPMSPTQVEQTVQALVRQRMTEAVPTPDVEATVSARLTAIAGDALGGAPTPAPTQTPVLTPVPATPEAGSGWLDGVGKAIGDFINTVVTFVASGFSLFQTIGQFGTLAQVCCCGLPLLLGGGALVSKLFDN